MKKINKLLTFLSVIVFSNSIFADEIIINQNFLKDENCTIVKELKFSSEVNSKKTMYEILKNKVKELDANAALNTKYSVNLFDTRTISSVIANCDLKSKSKVFFNNSDIIIDNDKELYNNYINEKIFTDISIIFDRVSKNVKNNGIDKKESKSSLGIGFKIGILENNYRYYADVKIATGVNLSTSFDYIYKIQNNLNLIVGLSLSMGNYKIQNDETITGLQKGFQLAISKNKFEIGFQYLDGGFDKNIANRNFKLNNTMYIYTAYRF